MAAHPVQPPRAPAGQVLEPTPPTAKGQRTKARILASARRVLEQKGYFEASVNDITSDCHVALGTFYRYFPNKDVAFMVLLETLVEELYNATNRSWNDQDRQGSLVEASRRYLTAYEHNRLLIGALLQMASASPACAEAWADLRRRTHRRMAAHGPRTPAGEDGELTIAALATMVEAAAHRWFIESRDGDAPSVDQAAETLGRIWHRALYRAADE